MKDITSQKFGRLTAIKPVGHTDKRVVIWRCKCECGKEKDIVGPHLRNGSTKSCGCLKKENIKAKFGREHHGWDGYMEISKSFLSRMKHSATLREIEWDLTPQYLWSIFVEQESKCALSGRKIKMPINIRDLRDKNNDDLASLDRIDSTKGYIKGNVQWICKRVNYMKHTMNEKVFLEYVSDIFHNTVREMFKE